MQAGTVRSLADDDGKRVKLVWGAMTLLVWIAVVWACWAILDWCDNRIMFWAGYFNSQAPAHWRARLFTYEHITRWMTILEWVLRWIVVPAKVIPYAMTSTQWGMRLPWRRVLHLLWDWSWWLVVVLAALLAVWLPGVFFTGEPHGTVSAQVWHVSLKLAASYLLVIGSWVLLLGWAAVLFGRQQPLARNEATEDLFRRLRASRRWIWAIIGWTALSVLDDLSLERHFTNQSWINPTAALVLLLMALILAAGTLRSLISDSGKRVWFVWGTLSMLLWAVPALIIAFSLSLWYTPIAPWVIGWVATPAVLLPFAAASALWGFRLPWRRLLRLVLEWRWWLSLLAAALAGVALPNLIDAVTHSGMATASLWLIGIKESVNWLLAVGSCVFVLGWFAVLFDRQPPQAAEVLIPNSVQAEPPQTDDSEVVKPPSSESR
jgi:hypothetical protein